LNKIIIVLLLLAVPAMASIELTAGFAGGTYQEGSIRDHKTAMDYYGEQYSIGARGSYRVAQDVKASKAGTHLKLVFLPLYFKSAYSYQQAQDEHQIGTDAGYAFHKRFNAAVGYIASYTPGLSHMGSLKLNFPILSGLIYKYHCRSDFGISGSRDYEWWQQIELSMEVNEDTNAVIKFIMDRLGIDRDCKVSFKYQLDRQYNFITHEYSTNIILKWGN